MLRRFTTLGLVLFITASAHADVLIVREKGKIAIKGIKSTIKVDGDKIEIDKNNVEAFMDEHSTGLVVANNYTGVVFKVREKDRSGRRYPHTSIVKILYTKEPDGLVDGYAEMGLGNWARAIGSFKDVVADKTLPSVHRSEANFRIGICYISQGKFKS
ncbi:MAG: hypothetical protein OER88_01095, partial [Planctomycetota bacterium]|nr:hypothetical protein [Planctomycetota bacterium]